MNGDQQESPDVTRQGRFNGIVVAVLVVVGLLGAWAMFTNLYQPAPAPAGAGHHALLVGPFREAATAEELRAKLEKLGIPSSVRVEAHLQVGPFRTPEEQEAAHARLKELGIYGAQPITLKQ